MTIKNISVKYSISRNTLYLLVSKNNEKARAPITSAIDVPLDCLKEPSKRLIFYNDIYLSLHDFLNLETKYFIGTYGSLNSKVVNNNNDWVLEKLNGFSYLYEAFNQYYTLLSEGCVEKDGLYFHIKYQSVIDGKLCEKNDSLLTSASEITEAYKKYIDTFTKEQLDIISKLFTLASVLEKIEDDSCN